MRGPFMITSSSNAQVKNLSLIHIWPVIFGIDGLEEALEAVKAGEMQGSILNDRVDQAKKMAKMAVELFEGCLLYTSRGV